jgi:K+-sensing histidine kinase KdpD
LNERRLQTLVQLSAATIDATRSQQALTDMCQLLVEALCRDNPDAVFAVQYLTESAQRVHRVAFAGVDSERFPQTVHSTDRDAWGIAETLRSRSHVALTCSPSQRLPGGVWPEATTQLLALPLFQSGHEVELCGVLLVGANPRLRLDAPLIDFLRLVATKFGSAISVLQSVHAVRQARADAQRAARLRDEFLATLSHQLRSPLNAVLGWTEILKNTAAGRI